MGRRPKPVDAEVEALSELAADLRRLRAQAGNPPYRAMAVKARYSASTLSEAASGRRLATLPVVLAYVAACGADTEGWQERWRQVAAAVHAHRENHPTEPPVGNQIDAVPPVAILPAAQKRKDLWGISARGFVIGETLLLLLVGVWGLPSAGPMAHTAVTSPKPSVVSARVMTEDTDPQDTACDRGEVDTVATANLYGPDRFFVGYVWLRYAPACGTMWARFEPAAGLAELGGVKVTIWLKRPADGRTLRYDTPYLGAFVYGNMLQTSHGCLKAEATVTAPRPTEGPATALPGTGAIVAHAETRCVWPPARSSSTMRHTFAP